MSMNFLATYIHHNVTHSHSDQILYLRALISSIFISITIRMGKQTLRTFSAAFALVYSFINHVTLL
jgi:hypothetical protein